MRWLLIAVGGAFGAVLRFWLSQWVDGLARSPFPYGTLAVNLLGSFLIGLLWQWGERALLPATLRPLLVTGMLGALTTFSTFSLQNILLVEAGRLPLALLNAGVNVVGCFAAGYAGFAFGR